MQLLFFTFILTQKQNLAPKRLLQQYLGHFLTTFYPPSHTKSKCCMCIYEYIAHTSIKCTISLQSTPMLKSCNLLMFDRIDTAFSYEREFIICSFLQYFSKGKESSLLSNCNAHTAFSFVRQYLLCRSPFPVTGNP